MLINPKCCRSKLALHIHNKPVGINKASVSLPDAQAICKWVELKIRVAEMVEVAEGEQVEGEEDLSSSFRKREVDTWQHDCH